MDTKQKTVLDDKPDYTFKELIFKNTLKQHRKITDANTSYPALNAARETGAEATSTYCLDRYSSQSTLQCSSGFTELMDEFLCPTVMTRARINDVCKFMTGAWPTIYTPSTDTSTTSDNKGSF